MMGKLSARFVANKVGMSTSWVYAMWENMGLVIRDEFGDWILTELGKKNGGKMSNGGRLSVPIFDFDRIEKMMIDFYNHRKK